MNQVLKYVSFICLALTIIPAFLVFNGSISLDQNKNLMAIGTLGWFLTAPFWMRQKKSDEVK